MRKILSNYALLIVSGLLTIVINRYAIEQYNERAAYFILLVLFMTWFQTLDLGLGTSFYKGSYIGMSYRRIMNQFINLRKKELLFYLIMVALTSIYISDYNIINSIAVLILGLLSVSIHTIKSYFDGKVITEFNYIIKIIMYFSIAGLIYLNIDPVYNLLISSIFIFIVSVLFVINFEIINKEKLNDKINNNLDSVIKYSILGFIIISLDKIILKNLLNNSDYANYLFYFDLFNKFQVIAFVYASININKIDYIGKRNYLFQIILYSTILFIFIYLFRNLIIYDILRMKSDFGFTINLIFTYITIIAIVVKNYVIINSGVTKISDSYIFEVFILAIFGIVALLINKYEVMFLGIFIRLLYNIRIILSLFLK